MTRTAIILATLLASGSAMGQQMVGPAFNIPPDMYKRLQEDGERDVARREHEAQAAREAPCYRYPEGPSFKQLRDACIAKVNR